MPPFSAPGVHRLDAFPQPPPSLLTGVPVFLGTAASGPWTAERVATWPRFVQLYGPGPAPLADAVRGFFACGGLVCQVVRLRGTDPAALRSGLAALAELDEIDLVCAPGIGAGDPAATVAAQRAVLGHCRARGDRVALLDALPAPGDVAAQAVALTGPDGAYGALYHPWLVVAGPTPRAVPPCGHVAGTASRGDREVGVHRAPANQELAEVLDVGVGLDAARVGELYAAGVNCIRALPGRGVRAWGARTLSGEPAGRDLAARRVLVTIARWLELFMAGLVHEPHDVRLRVRVLREVGAYLEGLHRQGALRGRTAEEAFSVRCDDQTNPAAAVEAGTVVTEVGVALGVAAEFVVVRVIHGASGVELRMPGDVPGNVKEN